MIYIACAIAIAAAFLVLASTVRARRRHFGESVVSTMRELAPSNDPHRVALPEADLPAPVARYRSLAVGTHAPVARVLVRHGGTFRTSPKAEPSEIRGVQAFSAAPPGFVWVGRVRLAPGLWIDARDQLAAGRGSMRVMLDDTVTLIDAIGPHLDQGAALRLLAELVWLPTALFDSRFVAWEPIDDMHARASLRVAELEVSATFTFGDDGYPRSVSAERYDDTGALREWGGVYSDWREVDGLRVPFEAKVSWELERGTFTYAHWHMESFTYDREIATSSNLEAMLAPAERHPTQTTRGDVSRAWS